MQHLQCQLNIHGESALAEHVSAAQTILMRPDVANTLLLRAAVLEQQQEPPSLGSVRSDMLTLIKDVNICSQNIR